MMGSGNSPAGNRQRSYIGPRSNAAINRPFGPTSAAAARQRNAPIDQTRNLEINRDRNFMADRTRNFDMNRGRNVNEFRGRDSMLAPSATVRNRNFTANRTQNFSYYREGNVEPRGGSVASARTNFGYYRGGNARIINNWGGGAFRGERYAAFRNYNRQWHDQGWWRSHYDRIVFVNGGWYYWNAGYWFPAWGYDPYVTYVYDGPIYAYGGFSPDQVTVNVQEALADAGYYDGPIDGVLGPMTRDAIAAFQADNGLAVTSAIDEPTLATMGLV
jgi:N-acetylmuramoyl-L-alanine amidase